ncbi:hypothetical protein BT63DRAFT_456786 [Microthyrium microscopicum]|uniref:U1-type domain-containing protein n=1 Tax=Microthyrium microscopicum TaxID=703497 RepID=A0A6A6U6D1_9PEZI|nr:hypothetical protein BT63DRAFT_456786 [Microthyrium microscopicum]
MSEFWKSTPKYWCKFCKVFVKDTKLEKSQHEATGRHQGAIQKSLRDLHRGKERDERDAQRAKDEVARLTGVVAAKSAPSSNAGASSTFVPPTITKAPKKTATVEDRKRQMQQLAAMGVALPDEYRAEMAMAGEWQTVRAPKQKLQPTKDGLVKGVHKRKSEAVEEEEEEVQPRRGWGRQEKIYPGQSADLDLDDLLKEPIKLKQDEVKEEEGLDLVLKTEETEVPAEQKTELSTTLEDMSSAPPTVEAPPGAGIVFKKRKTKQIRDKS